jgi:hypothetical protein
MTAADRIERENWNLGPVRARIVYGVMGYVFVSARTCGETPAAAQRQAGEASQWVKEVMKG